MKFEAKQLQAVLAVTEDSYYLRLDTPDSTTFIWYKPVEDGFRLIPDTKADELEIKYRKSLQ